MNKSNPLCSVCRIKTEAGEDATEFICPSCNRVYLPDKEITEFTEEEFKMSHTDEMPEVYGTGGGAGILTASDEQDMSLSDMLQRNPKYKPNFGGFTEKWD